MADYCAEPHRIAIATETTDVSDISNVSDVSSGGSGAIDTTTSTASIQTNFQLLHEKHQNDRIATASIRSKFELLHEKYQNDRIYQRKIDQQYGKSFGESYDIDENHRRLNASFEDITTNFESRILAPIIQAYNDAVMYKARIGESLKKYHSVKLDLDLAIAELGSTGAELDSTIAEEKVENIAKCADRYSSQYLETIVVLRECAQKYNKLEQTANHSMALIQEVELDSMTTADSYFFQLKKMKDDIKLYESMF